jgi:hypothetical protein
VLFVETLVAAMRAQGSSHLAPAIAATAERLVPNLREFRV